MGALVFHKHSLIFISYLIIDTQNPFYLNKNQSVVNAGVAFVKGADERNKLLEKINNQ